MPGEILADNESPMIMTVEQYNNQVAHTWNLATQTEQERIVKLLEQRICQCSCDFEIIALLKGENNG